jgi:uncharacterized protein
MELASRLALVEEVRADHIGREQVDRALDAGILGAKRQRKRAGKRRLADARIVLDQDVALGEQGHHQIANDLVANLDRPLDVRLQPGARLRYRNWIELRQRGHSAMVRAKGPLGFTTPRRVGERSSPTGALRGGGRRQGGVVPRVKDGGRNHSIARRLERLPTVELAGRRVPVAVTRVARMLGLAHLDREAAGPGLLIPRCRSVHTFGMRFGLDIHFLDGAMRPVSVRRCVPPRRIALERRARAVLELPAGGGTP